MNTTRPLRGIGQIDESFRRARAEVPEVWIVDLPAEVIEVYRRPTASGYAQLERTGPGGAVAPAAFPDLVLSVDAILVLPAAAGA